MYMTHATREETDFISESAIAVRYCPLKHRDVADELYENEI